MLFDNKMCFLFLYTYTVLLANISALSAIRYLRKYVRKEASGEKTSSHNDWIADTCSVHLSLHNNNTIRQYVWKAVNTMSCLCPPGKILSGQRFGMQWNVWTIGYTPICIIMFLLLKVAFTYLTGIVRVPLKLYWMGFLLVLRNNELLKWNIKII